MSDWSPFVQEARDGNFCGNWSPAMRCLSCGAGSKQCRQESGRRIIHGLVGSGVAKERIHWHSRQHWSMAYIG